jgi:uncharacterized protein (DUF58 family)
MRPSRLLILLVAALLLTAIALGTLSALKIEVPAFFPGAWQSALLALVLLALTDAWWLRQLPSPRLQRALPGNLALGRWQEVWLTVHHEFRSPLRIQLFDHLPEGLDFEFLPQQVALQPGQQSRFAYRLRPLRRGHFHLDVCELRLPSPLGLWQGRRLLPLHDETRVYPDFAALYGAQLTALDNWITQLGVRQQPRRGLGLEFHQLRDFRDGDTLRQIDWKATARKRTPIAREYQDERDQQIIFMLDCGRRMRSQDGELSHFDHALNALLLLSHVALRQADAVGLATFAGELDRFVPAIKGPTQLRVLLNAVYDLQTTQRPADFSAAVDTLLVRQQRRALVVILTNLRDEDDEELLQAVRRLGRRHRVMIASLREEVLDGLRQMPVQSHQQAIDYCGAMEYLNARSRLHERLATQGVPVLDVRPGELGPELISRYLAWKKAGTL